MQQLQQRAMLDPATAAAAAAHHLHLHQQQHAGGGHVHPAQTMTINRKMHGATGLAPGASHPLPPVYGDDNPPPLPPLRNPQKALPQPDATTTDAAGADKQIYIYSTAKYGKYDPNSKTAPHQYPAAMTGKTGDAPPPDKGSAGKNPNTTTFSSTPSFNSKPLPSIINCPLPDIPKSTSNGSGSTTSKDDIYVKRKLLSDHPNGSKFATLKPIPAPKIELNNLNSKQQQQPITNGANNGGTVEMAAQLPPPPPPPPPATTGNSSGSSGGSSSGYGTAGLTNSQIQSLPLPPPPLELLQQQQQQQNNSTTHPDDQGLRLPPPPTSEELRSSTMETNGANHSGDTVPNGGDSTTMADKAGHDENSFYAVTEL
uniref:Protein tweety homolog n=1 Tax=Anopheles epiroticus TaxID=199890 RepID=A0A182PUB0_9DIPT